MIVHHEKGLERIRPVADWRGRGLLPAASADAFITSDLRLTATGYWICGTRMSPE